MVTFDHNHKNLLKIFRVALVDYIALVEMHLAAPVGATYY